MSHKVRIACRRCRAKRIKCDGGVPACGNCQRAEEPCIDVDGRNNAISIPRDFAANARARIRWLEDAIRTLSPEFDLSHGPCVDFGFMEDPTSNHPSESLGPSHSPSAPTQPPSSVSRQVPGHVVQTGDQFTSRTSMVDTPSSINALGKRGHPAVVDQPPASQPDFPDEARSVALDLGLLSLNADSRQTHYLGTSSGRLFTSLIGAASPDSPSSQSSHTRHLPTPSVGRPGISGQYAHTKRAKESYRLLYSTLKDDMPPQEDARLLLEVYFRSIHVDIPCLHPGSLLDAVEALYQCAAADVATVGIGFKGWPETMAPFPYNGEYELVKGRSCTPISIFTATFHVMMVFTLASTVRTRQRIYDFAPRQFYQVATAIGPQCFSNTSTQSLQATLLLASCSLLSPAELNIWILAYVSMAHCVDLGLHRAPSRDSNLSEAAVLTRKMLFFSTYHLDRSVSAIQGRPLGIRDETFDVQIPSLDDVQTDSLALEDKLFAPEMNLTGGLAYALHRFKLDTIVSEIKLVFYHLPSRVNAYTWVNDHESSQASIRERLDAWRAETSSITSSMNVQDEAEEAEIHKYQLKLNSQYFATMILLYQPSQTLPHPSEQSLLTCYQCATSRLNTYNDLDNADGYYQSWRSVQGVFSSGATMIYCLWTSDLVRTTISLLDAMKDLRTCTNLLSVGGEWWPSAKKGRESFGRAMDALLSALGTQASQPGQAGGPQKRRFTFSGPQSSSDILSAQHPGAVPGSSAIAGHQLDIPSDRHTTEYAQHPESNMHFPGLPSDIPPSDWTTNFGNNNQAYHSIGLNDYGSFNIQQEAPGDTIEAFLADYLNGGTSWNAF